MSVMSRFTLRSLSKKKKWAAVTLIGIIISTAMLTAVSTFVTSFTELMRKEIIATDGNWHVRFIDVDTEDLARIESQDFVSRVNTGRNLGYAQIEGIVNVNKPYLYVKAIDADGSESFPIHLVEGRMPESENEIIIPQHLSDNGGVTLPIGSEIELELGRRYNAAGSELGENYSYQGRISDEPQPDDIDDSGTIANGEELRVDSQRSYTVVGIMERPANEVAWAAGYTAITRFDPSLISDNTSFFVNVIVDPVNRSFISEAEELAADLNLETDQVRFNTDLLRYSGVVANDNAQNMIYIFAAVFIIIIIVASVSLIYNAFAISVTERIVQLGMLASVGATKEQKRRSVFFEAFILGVIAIPFGIISGIAGIGITLKLITPLMSSFLVLNTSEGFALHVSWETVIVATCLAALTLFISAWIPARRASRIMPIEAIRQTQDVKLSARSIRSSFLTRIFFGFEGELALKNLKRNRRKFRATVISLTISLILFLTVSYYAAEVTKATSVTSSGINFDLSVSYNNLPREDVDNYKEQILGLNEVNRGSLLESSSGSIQVESGMVNPALQYGEEPIEFMTSVLSLDRESFETYANDLGLNVDAFQDATQPQAILINYGVMFIDGVRTAGEPIIMDNGETLSFSPNASDLSNDGQTVPLIVGAATDQRPLGVLTASLSELVFVMQDDVFRAWSKEFLAVTAEGNPANQTLYLQTDDPDAVELEIQALSRDMGSQVYIWNFRAEMNSQNNFMKVLGIFLYGFITLISLISMANIFNTLYTNISLRRREFAMLRSVGMTQKSFSKMIRFESFFYGLKALLWGIPLSLSITFFLHWSQSGVFDTGLTIPWTSYLVAVFLIFLIVSVTMLYATRKVKRENIVDALKSDIR